MNERREKERRVQQISFSHPERRQLLDRRLPDIIAAHQRFKERTMPCTSFDHVYPIPAGGGPVQAGTPCRCGQRAWGDAMHRAGRHTPTVETATSAQNNSSSSVDFTCNSTGDAVSSSSSVHTDATQSQEATDMATFNRRKLLKNGGATYSLPGVKGGFAISGNMFKEGVQPPETIDIAFDGFVEPNADATAKQAARDAKRAERESKKAQREQAKRDKAMAALNKAKEVAAKLGVNATVSVETPAAEAAAESTEQPAGEATQE